LKSTPTKTEAAGAILYERVHALTTSTHVPNDELGSSRKLFEADTSRYRKGPYFVSPRRSVIDRLKAAAMGFASIAMLIAGFIVAALCALDLLDMLRW
jgi:hypothetical protein